MAIDSRKKGKANLHLIKVTTSSTIREDSYLKHIQNPILHQTTAATMLKHTRSQQSLPKSSLHERTPVPNFILCPLPPNNDVTNRVATI